MRSWPLPLQARFIVFTCAVLIAVVLIFEFVVGHHSLPVLRNYPLTAHIRFILEEIRPEIRQYFLESEKDGTPFSRDKRALVYQRAKRAARTSGRSARSSTSMPAASNGSQPFDRAAAGSKGAVPHRRRRPGLQQALFGLDLQHLGDELRRAQRQRHPRAQQGRQARQFRPRHRRGRLQPLSPRKRRRHHLGDRLRLFRLPQRRRHVLARALRRKRRSDQIKMVEIKLSQGAKPGHGGVLPAPRSRPRSPRRAACRSASTASRRRAIRRSRRRSR
jgi:hypothetical protein